jgi:hypothetical protein
MIFDTVRIRLWLLYWDSSPQRCLDVFFLLFSFEFCDAANCLRPDRTEVNILLFDRRV